jgi:hypothetical protein
VTAHERRGANAPRGAKRTLVVADLVDVNVVVPRVEALTDRCEVALGIRATRDHLGDIVLRHHGNRLLVVLRVGQLVAQLSLERNVRADPVRLLPGLVLVLCPADVQLNVFGFPLAARLLETGDHLGVSREIEERVADSPGERCGPRPPGRHRDRGGRLRQGEEPAFSTR